MTSTRAPSSSASNPGVDRSLRLARLRERIASEQWNAALVLRTSDIYYLTGLKTTNAAVLVSDRDAYILTDFRYAAEARQLGGDWHVEMVSQSLYPALGRELGSWAGDGVVAYDPAALTHRAFLDLTGDLGEGVTLRAIDGVVTPLRLIKDDHELAAIRRSANLLEGAYEHLVTEGIVGRSEREVAWMGERWLREAGAESMAFDAIVASGRGGAEAHHSPGDELVPADTLVTIDIGCVLDGYASDCTRTFATGSPGRQLLEMYEIAQRAQKTGLEAVRAGAVCRDVDLAARAVIEDAGFGEYFGHGLGHGVGIDVHEEPRLNRSSNQQLEQGMVVTVEPGIYVEAIGGVRIEDLVVVTGDGPEILTGFTKDLVTVG